MSKKFIPILTAAFLFSFLHFSVEVGAATSGGYIQRLTQSGNNTVHYPCLSGDGQWVLYILETKESGTVTKSIHILNVETGQDRELFRSGIKPAPPPFTEASLDVGTKPPLLSGDGRVAVFSLNVGEPENIPDHFLAVVNTDGSELELFSFPIQALEGQNLKSLDIRIPEWERLSIYAIDSTGSRVACVVKGFLGPRRYGNPSGIVVLDLATKERRTLLAPEFVEEQWTWPAQPKNPLTGGGWGFGLSGNGQVIIFGAQSSDVKTDYDLYAADWQGKNIQKITDFSDRWFSLADISHDGKRIVFYYTGQKAQGIGTYLLDESNNNPVYLRSPSGSQVELFDMSGNGRFIIYRQVYKGILYDLATGSEHVAFDENTQGYAAGRTPMDLPRIPSFWCPQIFSNDGSRILLVGVPQGRAFPEVYMLFLNR